LSICPLIFPTSQSRKPLAAKRFVRSALVLLQDFQFRFIQKDGQKASTKSQFLKFQK